MKCSNITGTWKKRLGTHQKHPHNFLSDLTLDYTIFRVIILLSIFCKTCNGPTQWHIITLSEPGRDRRNQGFHQIKSTTKQSWVQQLTGYIHPTQISNRTSRCLPGIVEGGSSRCPAHFWSGFHQLQHRLATASHDGHEDLKTSDTVCAYETKWYK